MIPISPKDPQPCVKRDLCKLMRMVMDMALEVTIKRQMLKSEPSVIHYISAQRSKVRLLSVFQKIIFPDFKNNSEKGQSWRTDTAHLQDSLYSYNNPKE